MAESDTDSGEQQEGQGGGASKKKLIIIGAAAALVLVLIGVGVVMMMGGGKEQVAAATPEMSDVSAQHSYYFDLPMMILNLSAADERPAFVKLEITLEVGDQKMLEIIQPNLPRVLDAFQTYMRELRVGDLQGSAGLFRLKEELQRRVNIAIYPAHVDDVLFKNVIVQ